MRKFRSLIGRGFGRLTVMERSSTSYTSAYWKCLCVCGNEITVQASKLTSGHTRSCGCLRVEVSRQRRLDAVKTKTICGHNVPNMGGGLCKKCYMKKYVADNAQTLRPKRKAYYERTKDPEVRRARSLAHKYGITMDQYATMLEQQKGLCAICTRPPKMNKLNVDHDHFTGRVRGLLCWWCNHKLLSVRNSIPMLEKAIAYLQSNFDGRKL